MFKPALAAVALVLASTSAMANTGTIQFRGQINGATCPIDIVDPVTGAPISLINLGTFSTEYFKAANDKTPDRPFALWIRDGAACSFTTGDEVTVTFEGLDGVNGDYYLSKTGATFADNVGIAISDSTKALVKPGDDSASYPVNDTGETMLPFNASIAAVAAGVTAGAVSSDVRFTVNLP